MQSQLQSQIHSQGLTLPPKPKVRPSAACVSTKGSCVDPSSTDPDTGDSKFLLSLSYSFSYDLLSLINAMGKNHNTKWEGTFAVTNKSLFSKGLWSPEEDEKLVRHITKYGLGY